MKLWRTAAETVTEARLSILATGEDFADGVIPHEGNWLGGESFVFFDKKAVALLMTPLHSERLL